MGCVFKKLWSCFRAFLKRNKENKVYTALWDGNSKPSDTEVWRARLEVRGSTYAEPQMSEEIIDLL